MPPGAEFPPQLPQRPRPLRVGSRPGVQKQRGVLAAWVEAHQAKRRYVFTVDNAAELGLSTSALYASLRRLKATGRVAPVGGRRGLWAIIPVEYQVMGAPPYTWIIDDVMRQLNQPYYVGLGSAAAQYGATHYALQVLHVVTPSRLRPFSLGRLRVRFISKPDSRTTPVLEKVDVTTVRYSTPEATALDLVRFMAHAGGVSRVATSLQEIASHCTREGMRVALTAADAVADAQRIGYLWCLLGHEHLAAVTREWLNGRLLRPIALESHQPAAEGALMDAAWKVRVDHPVDLSL